MGVAHVLARGVLRTLSNTYDRAIINNSLIVLSCYYISPWVSIWNKFTERCRKNLSHFYGFSQVAFANFWFILLICKREFNASPKEPSSFWCSSHVVVGLTLHNFHCFIKGNNFSASASGTFDFVVLHMITFLFG